MRGMQKKLSIATGLIALFAALAVGQRAVERKVQALGAEASAEAAGGPVAPRFEVDPLWPKPLGNHWILGQTIGVSVDAQDHIWIIHRAGSLEAGEVHATTKPQ